MTRPNTDAVRVRVPAKINLHLGVGSLRRDGFHELHTVFHAVDLVDDIVATPADGLSLTVSGEGADLLPADERNLAWQAAELLATTVGVPADVRLELHKAIPVAGGMAGGSADAAAALVACARLWGLNLSVTDLMPLAARLGSDVTFPLLGGTALGTGRGERLSAIPTIGDLHWVLALADVGISAGDAYRELDRLRAAGSAPGPASGPDALIAALGSGDLDQIAAGLHNDLQVAAISLVPALADTLAVGRGALAAIVSGSGPTCAFLCRDADAATALAAELMKAGVCRMTRVARGPAPGTCSSEPERR
ncbi:MAG: 4-(cytidine 5'-diphospho)-2-C-methyl-D-erythritol kinase [Jatrophihabitans sp.]